MSEPTRNEILEWLKAVFNIVLSIRFYEPDAQIYHSIRRLIENRPRVTKEFVEKWAKKLWDREWWQPSDENPGGSTHKTEKYLYAMLRELGHEVEEEET